ncbi:MAG: glycosyltransferase [Candidatus Bipolaricaulia bacterium]
MSLKLADYQEIVGNSVIEELRALAEPLAGVSLLHINATRAGGGVAEMLLSLVPLFNDLGLETRWEVIEGTERFFETTKRFHNALQGNRIEIPEALLEEYRRVNRENAKRLDLSADVVVIHDPQPAALIAARPNSNWVWRCHIDLSAPDRDVWGFLSEYVKRYAAAIFSLEEFSQDLPIPEWIIPPSIDPLSDKNKELDKAQIEAVYERHRIPRDKPVLLQVSRFDRFKDPVGVVEAYRLAKKEVDCRLVLAGGGAADDPEGVEVLADVREAAGDDPDIHILDLPPDSHIEINALQRGADVVIQKSTKEGFGLTVTEGLWKGKPVVGGAVGGIKLQIIDGKTGYLVRSVAETAEKVLVLLRDPEWAKQLGEAGREHVRERFLITRHLKDYLQLIRSFQDR